MNRIVKYENSEGNRNIGMIKNLDAQMLFPIVLYSVW